MYFDYGVGNGMFSIGYGKKSPRRARQISCTLPSVIYVSLIKQIIAYKVSSFSNPLKVWEPISLSLLLSRYLKYIHICCQLNIVQMSHKLTETYIKVTSVLRSRAI